METSTGTQWVTRGEILRESVGSATGSAIKPAFPPELSTRVRDVRQMAAGAGIALGGKLTGRCVSLVGNVVLAHILGPAMFGLYAIGWTITKISTILTTLGLDSGVIRFASPSLGVDDGRLKGAITQSLQFSVFSGLILGAAFYFLAPWLGRNVFHQTELITVFRCFAFAFPLVTCLKVASAATRVSRRMKFSVYAEDIGQPLAALLLILVFYLFGWKLGGALAAFVFSFGIGLILAIHYVKQLFPEVTATNIRAVLAGRELLIFSLPTSLSVMFGVLLLWVDRLFVGYYCTAADAGIYHAVSQLSVALSVILSGFGAIVIPMIATLYHHGQKERLEELFRISTKWGLYLSLPPFMVMCFAPREAVTVIFGQPYAIGWVVLPILGMGQLLNSGTGPVGGLLIMTGHQNALSILSAAAFLINIVCAVLLVPLMGMIGAAIGTALTVGLLCAVSLFMASRYLKLQPYDLRYMKGLLATAAAAAVLLPLRLLPISSPAFYLVVAVFASASVFGGTLIALGLDTEDKEFLHLILGRVLRQSRG